MSKVRKPDCETGTAQTNFHRSRMPGTPQSKPAGAGPALTPESLARSVFGRAYWGKRQQTDLVNLSAAADVRMAAQRKEWKARHRDQLDAIAKEQRRKARAARAARAARGKTDQSEAD